MIVVPVSGGKDSQACLKLAVNEYGAENVQGLFCDTLFEHPMTYDHIEWMAQHYGVNITCINAGSVEEKILKYKRFPGGGARHCTEELKIVPSKKYYKKLAAQIGGFEVWYGVRANESAQRAKRYIGKVGDDVYPPNDVLRKYPKYLYKMGVVFRLPIIDWTEEDVFEYLDGEQNPLYKKGFDRVGCFPCLAGGDKSKAKAFFFDDTGKKHYEMVKELESITKVSIWRSKSGKESYGCSFCAI